MLQDYDLATYRNRAHALLSELRAPSGRLALKLASYPTQRAEALGLALAKLYLEFQDVIRDQAVVPLDAHLDLSRALQMTDELEDETSLRRTDLGLFDFDTSGPVPVLTCRLVEVKCYRLLQFSESGLKLAPGSAQLLARFAPVRPRAVFDIPSTTS